MISETCLPFLMTMARATALWFKRTPRHSWKPSWLTLEMQMAWGQWKMRPYHPTSAVTAAQPVSWMQKKLMQNYAGSEYGTSNYESAYGSTSSKVNHQGRSGSVRKGRQPRRRRRKRRRGRGQACEQESIGGPELGGEWNVRPTIADIAKSSTGRSRIRSTHPNDSSLEIEGIPLPINMQSIGSWVQRVSPSSWPYEEGPRKTHQIR